MKSLDQIITANSISPIDALREAHEFCNGRIETDNQNKTFTQLILDYLMVKFPDFFAKKTKTPSGDGGNRGKVNFKQGTLLWLAIGNHASMPIAESLTKWRTDCPELAACPDQTFRDYYNRFNKKGMRADAPKEVKVKPEPKTSPENRTRLTKPVIAVIPEDVVVDEPVVIDEAPVVMSDDMGVAMVPVVEPAVKTKTVKPGAAPAKKPAAKPTAAPAAKKAAPAKKSNKK